MWARISFWPLNPKLGKPIPWKTKLSARMRTESVSGLKKNCWTKLLNMPGSGCKNGPNVIKLNHSSIILLLYLIAEQVNLTGTEAGNRRPETGKGKALRSPWLKHLYS